MTMDRMSLRAWLALLLAASAILFFVGIYFERAAAGAGAAPAVTPSGQPAASEAAEGGGEGGDAGHSATGGTPAAEGGGETTGELRPLGVDLESPLLVGAAILTSLLLAIAVLRMSSPLVGLAIVGFALVFAVLDGLEVLHQLSASRIGLVAIAGVLVVIHAAAGLLAVWLLMNRQEPSPVAM